MRWFLVILLIPVGVTGVAAVGASLLGGSEVVPREAVREPRSSPLAILPTLFFVTFPSTLEEFGWRWYALGQLQMDQSALGASLLFGVVWAIWHLLSFFITGPFRREFAGVATSGFWLFVVGIVALSGTFTLVYDRTSRSSTNQTEY